MLDKLKITVGKFFCGILERHGLRVVLVDHDDNDTARLEWWAKGYMEPLTEESCQRALDFGTDLAHTQDFRKSIDNMRAKFSPNNPVTHGGAQPRSCV